MASLVEQIFMQAQAGSAQGQGFSDYFAQGAQLGQRRQQLDMQKQQLAAELAQLPLKQTLLRQDAEMNAIRIQDVLEQRQRRIGNEVQLMDLNKNVARSFTEAGGPEDAQVMLFESLKNNPNLISDPRFIELRKMVDTSLEAKKALIEARNQRAGMEGLGGVTIVTDPLTKEQKTYVRESANTIAPFQKTDPTKPQSNLGRLFADRNAAFKAGRTDEVAAFDKKIALEQAEKGFSLTTNPDGTVSATYGSAKGGDLTTATQTRLQQESSTNLEAINTLHDAIQGIRSTPYAIGVRGKIGTMIEQAKGQINPDQPIETPISDVRQKAAIAFSRVAPALRVDSGNMSRYELNKLEQAGDVLGIEESPQTAERKLLNLQSVVVARQLRLLKTQGKPVPDDVLRQVQGEEIAGLIQAGLLTREEATRLYQLSRPNGR